MKIELDVGGGSCLFERLKFMKLRARGVKGTRVGHGRIELNPDDYKKIEMEDKINKALFKKLEDLNLEDTGYLQKTLTILSKLMVITSVPLQFGGAIGGVAQRAMTHKREEALGKAVKNLCSEEALGKVKNLHSESLDWEEGLKIAAGAAEKTLDHVTGKTSIKERALKIALQNEISLMKDKIARVEKLIGSD